MVVTHGLREAATDARYSADPVVAKGRRTCPAGPVTFAVLLCLTVSACSFGAAAGAAACAPTGEGVAGRSGFEGDTDGSDPCPHARCIPGAPCFSTSTNLEATLQQPGGRRLAASRASPKRQPTPGAAYVSVGKVRAFTGDVHPTASLALALENRSFKRELILITDTRPRAALQLHYNLAQLGLVHTLWLTSSYAACSALGRLAAARDELIRQRQAAVATRAAAQGSTGGDDTASGAARALQGRDGAGADDGADDADTADGSTARSVAVSLYSAAATLAEAYPNAAESPSPSADDMMGCAWYGAPFPPGFRGHRRLMMKRVMLLARAVTMGYNVLSLDTDVIVYRDPYPLLKAPPYGAVQMIVGKAIRTGGIANTGVMYVHNARRSGPVAWMLSEVVDRNLRWVEHNVSLPHTAAAASTVAAAGAAAGAQRLMPYQADSRGCWDQYLFGDVLLTGLTGKLVLLYCTQPVDRSRVATAARAGAGAATVAARGAGAAGQGEGDGDWRARHYAAMNLMEGQSPMDLMQSEEVSVGNNAALSYLVSGKSYTTTTVVLPSPLRDPPPLLRDEPGYSLPEQRPGGAAEAFRRALQEDAAHAEARAGAAGSGGAGQQGAGRQLAQGAAAGGEERVAYAADWLVGGWPQRGVLGYWDPGLTNGRPKQVFGHLVRAPGPTNLGKDAVRMLYGEYDWELAALAAGGPFPFLGSPDAGEPPRVVALHPDADLATDSAKVWTNMARGLAQVALLTGRLVAWPAVPCDSAWVHPNPAPRRGLPLAANLRFLASGALAQGLSCLPATLLHQKCLYARHVVQRANDSAADGGAAGGDGGGEPDYNVRKEGPRGLLPPEFALLRRLLPEETAPGPHNTVHLQNNDDYDDAEAGERPVMFDEPPRAQGITYVKAGPVVKALMEGLLARERVLYLAQRTFLTQLDKLQLPDFMTKYRAFRSECPALR